MSDIVSLNGYKIKDEKAVRSYESVASMKADTKLKEGYHVKTKGYYEANDGGDGEYIIVDDETLVEDGGLIHILENGLRAKLIHDDSINVLQIGLIKNDTTKATENTNKLNNIINKVRTTIIPSGTFYLNDSIIINTLNHNLVGTAINNCNLVYNGNSNNSFLKIGDNNTLISGVKIEKITFGTYEGSGIENNVNAIEYVGVSPTHNIIEQCVFRYFKTAILGGRLGHVNNLTIRNNNIYTCYNGIDLQYYSNHQINAIYITENDISGCDNCGIIMYGNNMIIERNTIQNCKNYGISVGENTEHSFTQYCLNSTIDNNYFELNGSVSNDSVILLVGGYEDGSSYYRQISDLSIKNNFFAESIAKVNVISSNYHGHVSITADNNYSFYIKNGNKLKPGSFITSPAEQTIMPYNIEQSNAYALIKPNEYFYNIFNKNYFATDTPIGVDSDKQTSIIVYPTQAATTNISKDIQLAIIKANIVGTLGTNYWASNFNFETISKGTTLPVGSVNYEHTTGINTPIISPIFYTFYSNKPTGATLGYVHVIKIQGNGQASEFNIYMDMICNLLTARGYRVKINENENKDVVSSIPTEEPSTDNGKLVYCTEDSHWYAYYSSSWHQL